MKKTLIVLLVAVLALGSVFAEPKMTGNASISFAYNLEDTAWGFANATGTKTTFSFSLYSEKAEFGSAGSGDLYAEIEAKFTGSYGVNVKNNATSGSSVNITPSGTWKAEITKANIIAGEWTFGILNAGGGKNYAKSYWLNDSDKNENKVDMDSKKAPGFTVSYADQFNGGFGAKGNVEGKTYEVFAHGEYTGIEGLGVYAWTDLKDSAKVVGAGASYAYKEDKIDAYFGADFKYTIDGAAAIEVQADATYDIFTANAYYYTEDSFNGNHLDAKLSAKISDSAITEAYVDVRDIISEKKQTITAGASFKDLPISTVEVGTKLDGTSLYAKVEGSVDAVSYDASYATNYDFNNHTITANVAYKCDDFTAKVGTGYTKDSKGIVIGTSLTKATVEASIESSKVIDNCTVSLAYASADFAKNTSDEIINLGTITAMAKVSF